MGAGHAPLDDARLDSSEDVIGAVRGTSRDAHRANAACALSIIVLFVQTYELGKGKCLLLMQTAATFVLTVAVVDVRRRHNPS